MQLESPELRKWLEELSHFLVASPEDVIPYILERAKSAAEDGVFPLPGMDAEESRSFNATLLHRKRLGIQVPAPEGSGDDDPLVGEARAELAKALREEGLPDDTEVSGFTLGVGAGTGAAIITAVAGIVVILKDGPEAWKNVKRWATAFKRAALRDEYASLTVETLKLICVDNVLDEHPNLRHLDPELIAATVALGASPETNEQEALGPVYVVVPVEEVRATYMFVINWDGKILHRTKAPFFGAYLEESPEATALPPADDDEDPT